MRSTPREPLDATVILAGMGVAMFAFPLALSTPVSDIFSAVVRLVMVACGFAGLALAAVAAKSRQEITSGDRHDRHGGGPPRSRSESAAMSVVL